MDNVNVTMASSGCIRVVFLIFNVLFWIVGLGSLGYGLWILITNDINLFISGTLTFTYSFLGVGVYIALLGFVGCLGGCAESTCCLKVYVGLMVTLLFVDIGVIVAGCVQKDMSFYVMDELWNDFNLDTKEHIQKQLGCCGYSNNTEEYGDSIPGSCYQEGILSNTTCEDAMRAWVEGNIPIWASVLGCIGLIQIISFVLSCCVLKRVECLMKVGDSSVYLGDSSEYIR